MAGVTAEVALPEITCANCGQELDSAGPSQGELAFAQYLYKAGLRSGDAFRQLRLSLRYRAADLADLLNMNPVTLSRWEMSHGEVDRAAWIVLGAMVDDWMNGRTTTADRLRAVADPMVPKARVKLVAPLRSQVPDPPSSSEGQNPKSLRAASRGKTPRRRQRRSAPGARRRR